MMIKSKLLIGVAAVILFGCNPTSEQEAGREMPPALDMNNLNRDLDPKKDFYQFANGKWLERTEIPADEGSWGGFSALRDENNELVLEVMDRAADNPAFQEGSDERKAINLFAVGMDSLRAESIGVGAIASWIEKIDAIAGTEDLQKVLAELHRSGYGPFNGVSSFPDLKNSKINSLYLTAGGLGLPNRDYYTKEDDKSEDIRQKYVMHVWNIMDLAKVGGDAKQMADQVWDIENRLALASLTPIQARNIPALYNPYTLEGLQELAPAINWETYLVDVGVDMEKVDTLIVLQPKFLEEMSAVLTESSPEALKGYLKWNVVNRAAGYMNHEMVQTNFDFFGGVIRGTEQMRARWERVLGSTNSVIGEAIGKVYVAETFPPEAKQTAEEMVDNLLQAFDKRIKDLEWMSETTKLEALKKLNNMTVKIGYPDKWRDYSALNIENTGEFYSYLSNMENAWRWQFDENIKEIGEEVDKTRWGMSPQSVNAYFNPLNNEIVFPAAILQPPFYNYTADAAVNYGGMGAVIGHEISHAFDDQGSRFDWEGNMSNWWTDEDRENFNARTTKLVEQFDGYEALRNVNVQGRLTLGENIGDLGGLNSAYDALQIHLAKEGRPDNIDGFTPEQRFFLSWATIWRTKYRDETLRTQIMTDPHSPAMFRAVGPLENMNQFYEAFNIQEGDELWKAEEARVKIW